MVDGDRDLRVLIIDDEPDTIHAQLLDLGTDLNITIREPDKVAEGDIENSVLILVDYRLDFWPGRDALTSVTLKPLDGLALAAVLRSHTATDHDRPVAIALHAANLDELAGGRGTQSREQVIARLHNLEWAFRKTSAGGPVPKSDQLRSLANAVHSLPENWSGAASDGAIRQALDLLKLPDDESWIAQARSDVEDCHPPIHELALATHGLAFLRWLLQRVLPYPTFLRSSEFLAQSLRVTPASLAQALTKGSADLIDRLESIRYKGVLGEFFGHRWWKAGIEHLLWDLTDGKPFDQSLLETAVQEQLSDKLEAAGLQHPVVCVDERLRISDRLVERGDAVEIQPDDWPSYAQLPWASLDLMRERPAIAALVVEEDRERVQPPAGT